ncbi:phiRv1 phage protein [Mycobacterium tuberculosis]|nr:phiRv1 phage protein [Mycobacterium tuberculosis]
MTAVAITPASGGRHSVRFAYDSAIVSLIKSTIPAYARSWSAHTRCWFIDAD